MQLRLRRRRRRRRRRHFEPIELQSTQQCHVLIHRGPELGRHQILGLLRDLVQSGHRRVWEVAVVPALDTVARERSRQKSRRVLGRVRHLDK